MRFFGIFVSVLVLLAASSAADLKIKVVDPQSAAVSGAQVELFRTDSSTPAALQTTSADGLAVFRGADAASYRARILAAGFAELNLNVSSSSEAITVGLRLSPATETVNVSATRTLVPGSVAAADVEILNAGQLEVMRPVAADDALHFLPGAVVSTAGQRGGLSSLFVRGGESTYNKMIVDGVPVNDPGGIFDFGVSPLDGADRVELVRGAQSTLYGSEAMTSVVQVFTREGSTHVPELRVGADGGTFDTARGYALLAGARGPVDYNVFGEQTNSNGQGINDVYSSSSEGANVGVVLSDHVQFRLRTRHANSFTGVPGEWFTQATPPIPPDSEQHNRTNVFLASADLNIGGFGRWHHDLHGYEYNLHRLNEDTVPDRGCDPVVTFNFFDCPFRSLSSINRAGFQYQGEYWARTWARSTFGYEFEDENGFVSGAHGLRRNHALYGQEILT